MLLKVIINYSLWSLIITLSYESRENSKFLGNDLEEDVRHLGTRKRPGYQGSNPCNFGGGGYGKPKNQPTGRTFFDLQYYNVEHNYNLEINCGGHGGAYPVQHVPVQPAPVHEKPPISDPGHKPLGGHKPGGGGGFFGNGGGWFFGGGGNRPHRPMHGGGGGPFNHGGGGPFNHGGGGPFNHGGGAGEVEHPNPGSGQTSPSTGAFSGAFAGIFPSPSQFANGLSDGLQTFIGTLPAIGQSFQSILPSWSDIQLPQFNPGGQTGPVTFQPLFHGLGFTNPFNRPSNYVPPTSTLPSVITSKPIVPTTDPDDIIYSDEIKPVHEDYDPITDPYNSRAIGQYLVISNPHLGSYTHDVSQFNPTNLYNKVHQGIKEALDELGSYF